jgi:hypothetical protein
VRARAIIQLGAPVVAVAALMVGLRVGASDAVRAAVVFGAPPARAAAGGETRLAWQVLTFRDDRGVRETLALKGLSVTARARGQEARWTGESNEDGVAEVSLAFHVDAAAGSAGAGAFTAEDDVEIVVRQDGDPVPLAAGRAAWDERPDTWGAAPAAAAGTSEAAGTSAGTGTDGGTDARAGAHGGTGAAAGDGSPADASAVAAAVATSIVRPAKRDGAIGLDVVVEGERLVTGFPTPVWVRASTPPGVPRGGVTIAVTPEPGLRPERDRATTCDDGWAELSLVAEAHVTGAALAATAPGHPDVRGAWFGALPVAAGAFFPKMPRVLPAGAPAPVVLVAPNPRSVVYAEIDDTRGRAFGAALPVKLEPGDPTPRARFELPPLAEGLHWLVVSGEPRGAERLRGASIAKPFLVTASPSGALGDAPGVDVQSACSVGPWLAQRAASGFPRWVALDGLPARSAGNAGKRRLGLVIGVVALAAAGLLEALLLVATSREARVDLALASLEEDGVSAEEVTAKPPGGSLAIAILVAILGFALLAALFVAKA